VNDAFWQACHGGRRRAAEYLLARGADLNWTPDHAAKTPLDIAASLDTGRQALLNLLRERGAKSGGPRWLNSAPVRLPRQGLSP